MIYFCFYVTLRLCFYIGLGLRRKGKWKIVDDISDPYLLMEQLKPKTESKLLSLPHF